MPNKRSRRSQKQKFHCPWCQHQLWRLGNPKHYLFYQGISEIKKQFNLSKKNAGFLAAQDFVQVDRRTWLEEFFCKEHGKLWMRLTSRPDGIVVATLAKETDWKRSTRTIDPDCPNPSVSEYSYKMSRRTKAKQIN
jgi:hypothetical protein